MIYFIQAGDGGPIKIGYASNVSKRMAGMQCSTPHPLLLLAALPGMAAEEKYLHRRFDEFRLRGEWFHPDEKILSFVENPEEMNCGGAVEHPDAEFIEKVGGSGALAEAFGIKASRVSNWRMRGIPWQFRARFQGLARKRRVKLPEDFLSVKRVS